jgi:hypothetical protein
VRAIVAGLLLLAASLCRADVTLLIFSPSSPNSRDFITFAATTRFCELYGSQIGPATLDGNVVRVLGSGVVVRDSALCVLGIGSVSGEIGFLSAGTYSVELYIRDIRGVGTFLVRTDPLIVVEAPPLQAPAFSSWSLLALLLGVVGLVGMRRGGVSG